MYLDMGDIDKGYLLAQGFTTGAKIAAEAIHKKHKKVIELSVLDEYPILGDPSLDEQEKYY